ncbi:MAG: flavin monoamine oxidase family protein [Pseudolabrys sp.]
MSTSDTEVAIVGGGAAGIAAARCLAEAGVECLIIEARDRLGGRGWTVETDGFALDLGCGWLHSADRNPWSKIAQRQGRAIDKTPPPWARPSLEAGFPIGEQRAYIAAMNAFFERVGAAAQQDDDVAAAELLEAGGRWNGLIGTVGTFISGGELDQVSVRDFDNYADTDVNWRIVEGYGATIVAHAPAIRTALGCAVQRIDRSGARLRVETTHGTITADRVIVTLPSALIAEHEDLFAPALPEKTEAAAGLPLGLADKLFISLAQADEFPPDSRLFGRPDTGATAAYHLRPFGRPMIECYFGGRLAAGLERGGPAAFFDFAVSELTGVLGAEFAKRLKAGPMHPWGGDPFARGSYSYARPGKVACRAALAAAVEQRIFFAGEACSAHDFSTAHGAYLTGVAAAQQAITARAAA